MQRTIEIIINNSELTAGTRGSSLGPAAIMTAARKQENLFFGSIPRHKLPDFNHYLDRPVTTPFAKRIEGFSLVFEAVAQQTKMVLTDGKFPLIIAADHGSAAGTIAGIRIAQPEKRLGVVWIDAHGDLHSPYTTPSGNMHGMPLSLSLADDNCEISCNALDPLTQTTWENLKTYGGIIPKINGEDLVFIAVRDTEEEEDAIIARKNITNHTVAELRTVGVAETIRQVEEQLKDCDSIYVSFDVDSMDPELTSFGTGTPVGNGITPEEAKELLTLLARNPKTVCMEFVEVNPCLDNKVNAMAEITFSLIETVTEALNAN